MRGLSIGLALAGLVLQAQEDWLPPSGPAPAAPAARGDAVVFGELSYGRSAGRGTAQETWNAGLDGLWSHQAPAGLSTTLNARLDWDRGPEGVAPQGTVLSLREAYASWGPSEAWTLDLGRMQVRDGVALGFNPTDPFRLDATLATRMEDPDRLKDWRLGVLGFRAQYLERGRGFMLLLAPGVGAGPAAPAWYDPRLAATNRMARAYLKLMPGTSGPLYTNVILNANSEGGGALGLNLTRNLKEAVVVYAEGARTRRMPLEGGDGRWFGQGVVGATYATRWRQTLVLEGRYNGAPLLPGAVSAARWQEPAARNSAMVYLTWDRFLWAAGTLKGFWQKDLNGRGQTAWLELAHRFQRAVVSLSGWNAPSLQGPSTPWNLSTTLRFYF